MNGSLRSGRDRGESLVEVILAVVIVAVAVTAIVSALATTANAGIAQRDSALADTLLRNMAEDAKSAARTCTVGAPLAVDLTVPTHWRAAAAPSAPSCPPVASPLHLSFTVTAPGGTSSSLDVVVRTP